MNSIIVFTLSRGIIPPKYTKSKYKQKGNSQPFNINIYFTATCLVSFREIATAVRLYNGDSTQVTDVSDLRTASLPQTVSQVDLETD